MTIFPTKRTVANAKEESTDSSGQNVNKDRSTISHNGPSVSDNSGTCSRRQPFSYNNSSERKDRNFRKRFKESALDRSRDRDRDRERDQLREIRREQKRDRKSKREQSLERAEDVKASTADDSDIQPPSGVGEAKAVVPEEGSGCNSEDEYEIRKRATTEEDWVKRDEYFSRCVARMGFEIKKMQDDGACLFRAIADQVYGDQELHYMVRTQCMDYIVQNKDYFAPYVTEDFEKYVARKRKWNVHGNHLEIQALSEMYSRAIEVYCYHAEPMNIFNGPKITCYEPIRVSYHRMCHYNSITNPNKPSVLVGLGLPNYYTRYDLDRREVHDAVEESEALLIEQTMLEDKIKATDWEATNEALEEQVARESYIQYFRDAERRLSHTSAAAGSSSTITSGMCSSPRSSRRGSVSPPKGAISPLGGSSPKPQVRPSGANFSGYSTEPTLTNPSFDAEGLNYSNPCLSTINFPAPPLDGNLFSYETDCKLIADSPASPDEVQASGSTSVNDGFAIGDYEDWEERIMAQVLAESQLTYFDDLKRKVKKRIGSPGPSTSN